MEKYLGRTCKLRSIDGIHRLMTKPEFNGKDKYFVVVMELATGQLLSVQVDNVTIPPL